MAKGIDGPHDYREAIKMHTPDMPNSSSTGPKNQGQQGPDSQGSFSSAEFADAYSHSRAATPYGPTTPGKLGSSPMESPDCDGQGYMAGSPTTVSSMPDGARTYSWPDAPGGGLGRS